MAKLFSAVDAAKIQKSVQKSKQVLKPPKSTNTKSIANELNAISQSVIEYFQGSEAILITSKDQLHDYVTKVLEAGIAGIDTETTGVDRVEDWVVGASLYYPGGEECYIPMKHIVPIFDTPYRGQLSYEEVREEFQRIVDSDTKLVFANADFDLAMIYKDIKADLKDRCWYDVQIAWRCLKENEPHNGLKELYAKYVLKGKGDPKKFSDFFPPKLFPYCKPEVAKLYAANDAKITLELCFWQLPFITKDNPKCQKNHLERIADLIWNVEFPLIKVCHVMHRTGMYLDNETAKVLMARYQGRLDEAMTKLRDMVQEVINNAEYVPGNKPFLSGKDFNPKSPQHVKYLVYKLLKVPVGRDGESTDKEILAGINLPVTNQILKVRSLEVLINTFVEKLPNATTPDSRIHGQFKQIGARTGRFSSKSPNLQNIPSHATDIRHLFRATAADIENIQCQYNAETNQIKVQIPNWNKVHLQNGSTPNAIDLKVGDSLQCINGRQLMYADVLCASPCGRDVGVIEVVAQVDSVITPIHVSTFTPAYVMLSSDYSAQEPRLLAYVSNSKLLIKGFQENKDPYATIASVAFNVAYEQCLEFHPETKEYQPDGKRRRSEAKTILLGIMYGRAIPSIAEQLYSSRDDMSKEEKIKSAQHVYDSVMTAFPDIRQAMLDAQAQAREHGYTETILGRRRHIPDMMLPPFQFVPMDGYVNPDIDPLDPSTLNQTDKIPKRITAALEKEFAGYKYFGQKVKRIKQLAEERIKVINNEAKIGDASRQALNSVIQGSAADQTKMAILLLENNEEWRKLGGRLLTPVHDELICEIPIENYERGGELLSSLMVQAADFLPFTSKCDVTTSYRWYGLEYPCTHKKPESFKSLDDIGHLSEDETCWLQYMLYEMEYPLPTHKDILGEEFRGDKALGIDGIYSDELVQYVKDYTSKYNVHIEDFVDAIWTQVDQGTIPNTI